VVYARIHQTGRIWVKLVKINWDPFESENHPYIVINKKARILIKDGTLSLPPSLYDSLSGIYGSTQKSSNLDRWMYVSKSKRVLCALQRS
jgi:hypothetical protein